MLHTQCSRNCTGGLLLSPVCRAQGEPRRRAGEQVQNPTAGAGQNRSAAQDRNQAPSGVETIRGVISGITAEGEIMLDYRTNTAARTEGAYLMTIIDSAPSSPMRATGTARSQGPRAGSPGGPAKGATTFISPGCRHALRYSIRSRIPASPTRIGGRPIAEARTRNKPRRSRSTNSKLEIMSRSSLARRKTQPPITMCAAGQQMPRPKTQPSSHFRRLCDVDRRTACNAGTQQVQLQK